MGSKSPVFDANYSLIWGLLFLFAVAVCLVIILLWIFRHAKLAAQKHAAGGKPDGPKEPDSSSALSEEDARATNFDLAFRRNLDRLRQLAAGRSYRYDVPWALVVGTSGSGKTTALNSIGLRRTFSTERAPQPRLGVGWHFFNEGLAIDVPGSVFLGIGDELRGDRLWRRLLWHLRTVRSRRPLDSVVLVLSVDDLRAQSNGGPSRLALLVRDRLSTLQKGIEMRVPVYLLITKCDLLTGFDAFSRELPETLRGQMLGWSNPHSIDLAFSPGWIDEAVFSTGDRIDRLTFEMFATDAGKANADEMFLLRNQLNGLQSGLSEFASRIFSETSYGQSPLLRGIYLTGDPDGSPVPNDLRANRAPQANPVFLDDLFARKIYAEKGVATPFPNALLSGNRLTLSMQIATLVFATSAAIGTMAAYSRLNAIKQNQLTPLLAILRYQVGTSSNFSGDTAFQVVRAMTDLQAQPFRSLFFPQSWSDRIDNSLGDVMVKSFLTVFEGLRTALAAKHAQIVAKISATPSQCSNPGSREQHVGHVGQYEQLNAFVEALDKWNTNVERFDQIVTPGSGNPDELKQLVLYLNPNLLPQEIDFRNNPYFQRALNRASDRKFQSFDAGTTTDAGKQLSACFFNAWFGSNVILTYTDEIEKQIQELQTGSMSFDDLESLSQIIGTASSLLDQPEFQWAAKEHFDAADYPVFQNAVLHSSVVDSSDLTKYINETGDEAFQTFRTALSQKPTPGIGTIVEQGSGTLMLSDGLLALSAFIGKMEQQPFAAHTPEGNVPAKALGRWTIWNPETLTSAIQLYRTFSTYNFGTLPAVFRAPVQAIAATRTQSNMLDLIASAQSFQSASAESAGVSTEQLGGKNLAAAVASLTELLQTFSHPGFSSGRATLASVVSDQARELLNSLDNSEASLNPYEVKDSSFQWWNGETPLSPLAYQVPTAEAVKAAIDSQTASLRDLAGAAAPALNLLQVSNSLSAMPAHVSRVNWAGVIEDFSKLDAKKSNSISSLETFLTSGMDKIRPDSSCIDTSVPPSGSGSDLFVSVQETIRNDLMTRCHQLAGNGYAQIAASFNEHLAGRFPFSDPAGDLDGVEADPSDIVKFFSIFDRYQTSAAETLKSPASSDAIQSKQLAFLQRMAALRPVFANLLPSGAAKNAVPSYDLQVQFRTDRTAEIQGDQIIDWELDVAAQSVVPDAKSSSVSWHIGDPTRLSLRFAKNSPLRPVLAAGSPGQVVGNRTVSFEYSDPWSLFRLIQLHKEKAFPVSPGTPPGPLTLSFYIPTVPDTSVLGNGNQPIGGQVRVYLQLIVASASAKDGLLFPDFPVNAPLPVAAPVALASTQ